MGASIDRVEWPTTGAASVRLSDPSSADRGRWRDIRYEGILRDASAPVIHSRRLPECGGASPNKQSQMGSTGGSDAAR
jgi:hypothetical protein